MVGNTLTVNVSRSECFSGRTVFELGTDVQHRFRKIRLENGTVLELEPVHYKYINPFESHPRKYAVMGEYDLSGTQIVLLDDEGKARQRHK